MFFHNFLSSVLTTTTRRSWKTRTDTNCNTKVYWTDFLVFWRSCCAEHKFVINATAIHKTLNFSQNSHVVKKSCKPVNWLPTETCIFWPLPLVVAFSNSFFSQFEQAVLTHWLAKKIIWTYCHPSDLFASQGGKYSFHAFLLKCKPFPVLSFLILGCGDKEGEEMRVATPKSLSLVVLSVAVISRICIWQYKLPFYCLAFCCSYVNVLGEFGHYRRGDHVMIHALLCNSDLE